MDTSQRTMTVLFLLCFGAELAVAQSPQSFFPHHVGDLWQYRFGGVLLAWTERLDSMFVDTSGVEFFRYNRLYHDIIPYTQVGWYGIRDSVLVFEAQVPGSFLVRPLYRLDAQLGEVWIVDSSTFEIAKIAVIDSLTIFGQRVPSKEIWYGYPGPGPSDTSWWDTRTLASGFGLTHAQLEPMGPVYLSGAIIDSVHWGLIVGVSEPIETPNRFSLEQNYPNPFNPSTTITFTIAHSTWVKLVVYDVLGRQVQTLVDGALEPGTHSIVWNARAYSSGVYFYRLETREGTATKRMLLQK